MARSASLSARASASQRAISPAKAVAASPTQAPCSGASCPRSAARSACTSRVDVEHVPARHAPSPRPWCRTRRLPTRSCRCPSAMSSPSSPPAGVCRCCAGHGGSTTPIRGGVRGNRVQLRTRRRHGEGPGRRGGHRPLRSCGAASRRPSRRPPRPRAAPAAVCRQPTLSCASPSSTTYQSTSAPVRAATGFPVGHDGPPREPGVVVEPGQRRAPRHRPVELRPQLGAGALRLGVGVVPERRALDGDQVAAVRRTGGCQQAAPPLRQPARVGPPCGQPHRVSVLDELAGTRRAGRGRPRAARCPPRTAPRRRRPPRRRGRARSGRCRARRDGREPVRRGRRRRRLGRPDARARAPGPTGRRRRWRPEQSRGQPQRTHHRCGCPAARPRARRAPRPRRAVRRAAASGRRRRPAAPAVTARDRRRPRPPGRPSTTAASGGASAQRTASAPRSTGGSPTRAPAAAATAPRARPAPRPGRSTVPPAPTPSSSAVTSSRTAPPTGTRHAVTTRPPETRTMSVPDCPASTTTASAGTGASTSAVSAGGAEPSAATAAGTTAPPATVGGTTGGAPRAVHDDQFLRGPVQQRRQPGREHSRGVALRHRQLREQPRTRVVDRHPHPRAPCRHGHAVHGSACPGSMSGSGGSHASWTRRGCRAAGRRACPAPVAAAAA